MDVKQNVGNVVNGDKKDKNKEGVDNVGKVNK